MLRLIIIVVFFLLSLLTLFPAPAMFLWYAAIIVTEFSWVFMLVSLGLFVWAFRDKKLKVPGLTLSLAAFFLYAIPLLQASQLSARLDTEMARAFGNGNAGGNPAPYSFFRMFKRSGKEAPYDVLLYDSVHKLTLDYYTPEIKGHPAKIFKNPCVVVVHGGSWKGGDSRQLPELNSVLAGNGYNVASINYRKAPECQSPAPVQDLHNALVFLRANAEHLNIDNSRFVLLGRSAGGQISASIRA